MAMMECAYCGLPVDARAMGACPECGLILCYACAKQRHDSCPNCGARGDDRRFQ